MKSLFIKRPHLQVPDSELSRNAKWYGFEERALDWKSKP